MSTRTQSGGSALRKPQDVAKSSSAGAGAQRSAPVAQAAGVKKPSAASVSKQREAEKAELTARVKAANAKWRMQREADGGSGDPVDDDNALPTSKDVTNVLGDNDDEDLAAMAAGYGT